MPTGSLGGAERAAAIAAAASQGLPAPLRPTKELYQEKSLNLTGEVRYFVTKNQQGGLPNCLDTQHAGTLTLRLCRPLHTRSMPCRQRRSCAGCAGPCATPGVWICFHVSDEACCARGVLLLLSLQMPGRACTWHVGVRPWCTRA